MTSQLSELILEKSSEIEPREDQTLTQDYKTPDLDDKTHCQVHGCPLMVDQSPDWVGDGKPA